MCFFLGNAKTSTIGKDSGKKKGWGRNFKFLQIVDKMVKKIPVNQLHPQHDGIGMMNESPC